MMRNSVVCVVCSISMLKFRCSSLMLCSILVNGVGMCMGFVVLGMIYSMMLIVRIDSMLMIVNSLFILI